MIEMKPCPFCGNDGTGPIEDALHVVFNEHDWRDPSWSVQCDKCTATMGYSDSEDEAIDRWNTRQNISDVLIEALVTKAICQSGKFETGQGTCAAICMEVLGSARSGPHGCPHSARVHGRLAASIADALRQAKGGSDAS